MIIKNTRPVFSKRLQAFIHSRALNKKTALAMLLLLAASGMLIVFSTTVNLVQPQVTITPTDVYQAGPTEIQLGQTFSFHENDIRYTLDGSDPTVESERYTTPIPVEKTSVVNAALFNGSQRVSPVLYKTIFVETNHTLPIVSLVTTPENLWDPDTGIYTAGDDEEINFEQRGKEWERPAHFTYFARGEADELAQAYDRDIGIRINGGGSRELPQRSIRLIASYADDTERFEYDFFPEDGVESHDTLILRNAGTDWNYAYLRDSFIHLTAQDSTQLDYQATQPVAVYLNGEYWGLYYLRERYDDHYFEDKYDLDSERISILDIPHDHGLERGKAVLDQGYQSDVEQYNQLLEQATACRGCARYNDFLPYIDLENFIDYTIFEFYFANFDWPFGNSKVWKYHNTVLGENPQLDSDLPYGLDGRFRWLLFDLDVGIGFYSEDEEAMTKAANSGMLGLLIDDKFPFRNLFYDETFRENFLNRYANLLNTELSSDAAIARLDQLEDQLASEMPRQIERWKGETSPLGIRQFQSMEEWREEVALVRTYLELRPEGVIQEIFKTFYTDDEGKYIISRPEMLDVRLAVNDPVAGDIQVHRTVFAGENAPYDNRYFPEQSINITALPSFGWRFSHWEGDAAGSQRNNPNLRVKLTNDMQLTAVFRKSGLF